LRGLTYFSYIALVRNYMTNKGRNRSTMSTLSTLVKATQ
jgi:hypothetical protein